MDGAGQIVLGPPAALLSEDERADVLRHEAVHAVQQRLAATDESATARAHAERLAEGGTLPTAAELGEPAPALLAAPITGKPATGFDRLFASEADIIGEVVESGVTVRAARDFHNLGIEAPVDTKSTFGTASMTDLQYLSCGNKALPALEKLAGKLREVAKGVARVNGSIAAGSPWRHRGHRRDPRARVAGIQDQGPPGLDPRPREPAAGHRRLPEV